MSRPKLAVSIKKVKRGAIQATHRHNMRQDVEHWSTEHVDKERIPYNMILIGKNVKDDITEDIAGCDMKCNMKRNPQEDVIAAEYIISFGKPWTEMGIPDGPLTKETCENLKTNPNFLAWLVAVRQTLEKDERCVNAILHLDEETPHVHAVCSVKEKRESKAKTSKSARRSKKSEYVLSYNSYYGADRLTYQLGRATGEKRKKLEEKYGVTYDSTQTPLGMLQTRLWKKIGKPFGLDRGEAASVTGIKHETPTEYRLRIAREKADADTRKKIEAYQEKVADNVASEKKEIDDKAISEISAYRSASDSLVAAKKLKIDSEAIQTIETYQDEITVIVTSEKKEIDDKADSEISVYRNASASSVTAAKLDIDDRAIQTIQAYQAEITGKVVAEKKEIDDQASSAISAYRSASDSSVAAKKEEIDSQAAQTIEAYQTESSSNVASQKKEIDDKAASEISTYRTSSDSSVTAKKEEIDSQATQTVEAYRTETSVNVASQKKEINDKAASDITDYRTKSESSVSVKKQEIDSQADQIIAAYDSEVSKKIIFDKKKIDDEHNKTIIEYKKIKIDKVESYKKEVEQEILLIEEQQKLTKQSIKLKKEENAKIKKAIELFLSKINNVSNIIKNHIDVITQRINAVDLLSKTLGYTIGKNTAVDKLMKFRTQLKADRRYGVGKRMIALRQNAISAIDQGIAAAKIAKEAKNQMNTIKDSLTVIYQGME